MVIKCIRKILFVFLLLTIFILFSINNNTSVAITCTISNFEETHKIIEFSDRIWIVESYMNEKVNPGPNFFSSSDNNVWIDQRGFLNLSIQKNSFEQWVCSSVKSLEPASYGTHRFKVIGNIEKMDKNIVLGLFMYRIDPDNPTKRAEIDIEFSTWGLPYESTEGTIEATTNGHYTLWKPWAENDKPNIQTVESFWVSMPRGTYTTHEIKWSNNNIEFISYYGHSTINPNHSIIHQYSIEDDEISNWLIPHEEEKLHIMMNLWIQGNHEAPYDQKEYQMKIKYEFEPMPST